MTGLELLAASAAEHLTGADPFYWTCEYCRATPGVPCRANTGTGRVLSVAESHKSRREQCGRWQRWSIG